MTNRPQAQPQAQALKLHENLRGKRGTALRGLCENQVQRVNRRHNERYPDDQPYVVRIHAAKERSWSIFALDLDQRAAGVGALLAFRDLGAYRDIASLAV